MTQQIGAWERKAKISLVDVQHDKEIFLNVLDRLEEENSLNQHVLKLSMPQIELARKNLAGDSSKKFICMFVWGYETQHYLPFCSDAFDAENTEYLEKIIHLYIDISIQCCSDGFEVVTFGEHNKLLAMTMQALCENEMMRINLQHKQDTDNAH